MRKRVTYNPTYTQLLKQIGNGLIPGWVRYRKEKRHYLETLSLYESLYISKLPSAEQQTLLADTLLRGKRAVREVIPKQRPNAKPLYRIEPVQELPPDLQRLLNILDKVNASHAEFCLVTDSVFRREGLGEESRTSGWKTRIDRAHGLIAEVLREIKETVVTDNYNPS